MKDVPRVHRPRPEEVHERLEDGPLVLTGCLEDSRLLRAMRELPDDGERLTYLARRAGDVTASLKTIDRSADGREALVKTRLGSLRDHLAEIGRVVGGSTGTAAFVPGAPLDLLPELMKEVELPFTGGQPPGPLHLWIGSGGHHTNLHYDRCQHFIGMFHGVKRWTLLPPGVLPDIYPAPLDRTMEGAPTTLVNLRTWTRDDFPRMEAALRQRRVVDLAPGEMLCLPPLWWHDVESIGLNVMANRNVLFFDAEELAFHLEEAIVLFWPMPEPARRLFSALFRAEVFGLPAGDAPLGDVELPSSYQLLRAKSVVTRAGEVARGLSRLWREAYALFFDFFAFHLMGDPFPTLPGEAEAMFRRLATPMGRIGLAAHRYSRPVLMKYYALRAALARRRDRMTAAR